MRRDTLAEDLAIAAAAVGLILVEQPRDLAARAVRVPAHLEQPGLGAVGGGVAGGAVAAFAVAARRFAHAQADHQHEQVPQRIDPADVVAHAERREPGGVVGERVAMAVAARGSGHLHCRRVALRELALRDREHHGHALDVAERRPAAATIPRHPRERRVRGDLHDLAYWQRRPVKHRILPLAARRARRPRCMSHPRCARSCEATTDLATADLAATDVVPTDPVDRGVGRAATASACRPAAGSGRTRNHRELRPLGYSHGKVVLYTMTSYMQLTIADFLKKG